MANDDDLERLRKAIRTKVREGADLVLPAADARLLLDELGRLQQSNDRLRRQNRRVRLRLQRAGLEADDATDGDRDEGETPAP
ncbi:MAG: hypothetical protein JNK78_14600 [Planctomycetes bacterium]|nr:hypothetical protein [Planctomycetota bacterium]